jgi:hypothetical protein
MVIVPITLRTANAFVGNNHRHHKPTVGHKWSVGLMVDNKLAGVAIVGRPVSRHLDNGATAEVTRLCTDGTPNACSKLYGACARIAKEMGYNKIQSYILDVEGGVSLKASGWIMEAMSPGGQWVRNDGIVNRIDQPLNAKQRWVRYL